MWKINQRNRRAKTIVIDSAGSKTQDRPLSNATCLVSSKTIKRTSFTNDEMIWLILFNFNWNHRVLTLFNNLFSHSFINVFKFHHPAVLEFWFYVYFKNDDQQSIERFGLQLTLNC